MSCIWFVDRCFLFSIEVIYAHVCSRLAIACQGKPPSLTVPVEEGLCGAESVSPQLGLLGRAWGVGGALLCLRRLRRPLRRPSPAAAVTCGGARALRRRRSLDWPWVWVATVGGHGWGRTTQTSLGGHGQLAAETHHHASGPQAATHHLQEKKGPL